MKDNSYIIEPDFQDLELPLDLYQNRQYRMLMEITIKNVSSNPITVLSMRLNGFFKYDQNVIPAEEYYVTTKSEKKTVGGITYYGQGNTNIYGKNWKWIKLPLDLEPFHATRGFIMIPMYAHDLNKIRLNSNKNWIVIETTSKDFKFKINIGGIVKRDTGLSKNDLWE